MESKIIAILGKPGSGKSSLKKSLEKLGFIPMLECTNRPKRPGEIDGRDYMFLSEEEIKDGNIIGRKSYDTKEGRWTYGIMNTELDPAAEYVVILNPYQVQEFNKVYGDKAYLVFINVMVDEEQRIINLIKREEEKNNPDYKEICRRICADAWDFSKENSDWSNISFVDVYNNYKYSMDEIANEFAWNHR